MYMQDDSVTVPQMPRQPRICGVWHLDHCQAGLVLADTTRLASKRRGPRARPAPWMLHCGRINLASRYPSRGACVVPFAVGVAWLACGPCGPHVATRRAMRGPRGPRTTLRGFEPHKAKGLPTRGCLPHVRRGLGVRPWPRRALARQGVHYFAA